MPLSNMESDKIVQNETKISGKVNNTNSPSVNFPNNNSSNENGNSSQNNPLDSNGANDKKEPKLSKSKKKKKNSKKGKNKDAVAALQNEAKDEVKTHDSEPEKSSELKIDSEKEEHENLKTEGLLDQSWTMATQEGHKKNPTINQRRATISKDNIINTEASESKISEAADLGTKTSTIEDVSTITVPENTSISLPNTVPIILESKPQNSPNPDGSEISYCNPSTANDDNQDEFNVQKSNESIKESKEFPELKNPHLVASSTNELAEKNAVLESQPLANNLIIKRGDFKAVSDSFVAATAAISLIEDNVASTSLNSESCPLFQEKPSSQSLRDAAINKKISEVTEKNEDSMRSHFETGLESTSKVLMNLEKKIVKDVESNLSTTTLGTNIGKLIKGSNFEEPELSSSSLLKETDMKTQVEQQTTGETRDDNIKTGTTPLQNFSELAGITSKLQNVNNEIQMTSSNSLSESNAPVDADITEVRDLFDNTIAMSEHVIREEPSVSVVIKDIMQPEVLRSESSAVLDGNIISDLTESSALAEEIATSINSLIDFKEFNEETEVIKTNTKETIDTISHSFETDESNFTEGKIIGSSRKDVSEPIGDISTDEETLVTHPDYIESAQNESSSLCTCSKTLKEQDKQLTAAVLKNASDAEERTSGPQDHAETITMETFQSESWKSSSESTAGKAKSLINNEVSQASNQIGISRHSKSEIPNSEIVNNTSSDSKNDEIHSQKLAQYSEVEEKSPLKNLSNSVHSDISNPKEMLESEVDLVGVKSDSEVSAISPTIDIFGSSAPLEEITNKTKLKFKPSVGEQALAPELVTISKETLDLLYKRLDSMQLEIERLSSALNSQNKTTPASPQDISNNSLKDDQLIAESSQQNSKIAEEETVNTKTMKQSSKNKSTIKSSCLWRLMSIFGYKTITKSDAGLVTRSVNENLLSPSRGSKGKGKEIIAQPNKPSTTRTYKIIGRVRAKHDLS